MANLQVSTGLTRKLFRNNLDCRDKFIIHRGLTTKPHHLREWKGLLLLLLQLKSIDIALLSYGAKGTVTEGMESYKQLVPLACNQLLKLPLRL